MSPLIKGALASAECTARLLPLLDVDGYMSGLGKLDVVLLVMQAPGAAVELRFLFFGGITPISTLLSVLVLQLSS